MDSKHRERIAESLQSQPPYVTLKLCLGYKGSYRYDEELFIQIAKLFYEMQNLPQAGLYWMLTREASPEAESAIEAAIKGHGPDLVSRLPVHTTLDKMPEGTSDRLRAYLQTAGVRDVEEAIRSFARKGRVESASILQSKAFWKFTGAGCGLLALSVFFIFLCGVYSIIKAAFFK